MHMDYNNIFAKYGGCTHLGLADGRCGLVLLASLLSDKDERYKDTVATHLGYLREHVYETSSLSFRDGLLGIGWALEFLCQNLYIPTCHDDLLTDMDDIIYKWINFHGLNNISLNNGYLGCLLYLCYRLKGNRISTPYRELALKECTVRILGQIYALTNDRERMPFSQTEWFQLHILAGLFKSMNIQNHIADSILQITRKVMKHGHPPFTPPQDTLLMNGIHRLCETSKRHKVIRNFFLAVQ